MGRKIQPAVFFIKRIWNSKNDTTRKNSNKGQDYGLLFTISFLYDEYMEYTL